MCRRPQKSCAGTAAHTFLAQIHRAICFPRLTKSELAATPARQTGSGSAARACLHTAPGQPRRARRQRPAGGQQAARSTHAWLAASTTFGGGATEGGSMNRVVCKCPRLIEGRRPDLSEWDPMKILQ